MTQFDCTIVGAGIQGLCTAFWLRQLGVRDVAVIERHEPGHQRGSSHGATRITRSSYHDTHYARLAREAETTAWPVVERELGRALRVRTPGLFFGPPDGPFGDYLRATLASGADVAAIPADAARRRFPLLVIEAHDVALLDRTAAIVLAADTMQGLRQWLAEHDVAMFWNTAVERVEERGGAVHVVTTAGEFHSRTAVLAAGPWLNRFEPAARPAAVVRQEVGYFDIDVDAVDCEAGRFPVWARIGRTPEDFHYGLPSVGGSGLKIAAHRTTGRSTDPDAPAPPVDERALHALAAARLTAPIRALRATERCLYTMADDHGFRIAEAAGTRAVLVIAACSGHAFKFAPLLGRRAAESVRDRARRS